MTDENFTMNNWMREQARAKQERLDHIWNRVMEATAAHGLTPPPGGDQAGGGDAA